MNKYDNVYSWKTEKLKWRNEKIALCIWMFILIVITILFIIRISETSSNEELSAVMFDKQDCASFVEYVPQPVMIGNISYYTASKSETDDSPCYTADMTYVCNETLNTVANNCLPFDSKVKINGTVYVVRDRLNSRYGCQYFDILVESNSEAIKNGRHEAFVQFLDL